MEKHNPLVQLMQKYQRGGRPVVPLGPFLPLLPIRERGLRFNDILRDVQPMTEAALLSFEFGFESVVLPFDLNVEAEILGAEVRYYEDVDGIPVYPTIVDKSVTSADDIEIPPDLGRAGRLPVILEAVGAIKQEAPDKGAVGVFVPGPFTLAGQVMDMDALFMMLMKQPDASREIFKHITELILQLKQVYAAAGIDYMIVVEGGGASISPKVFRKLLLPCLQEIFAATQIPSIISLFGNSKKVVEFMLACNPDGIILDRECDPQMARELIPGGMPLFGSCGALDMLATATPAEVTAEVNRRLIQGFTTVGPPADIYPPALIENITAFVAALREYKG
jgi:[methyl-Co(III) methanol-specific corrinoid protein]:coenzyme M methyltransferase